MSPSKEMPFFIFFYPSTPECSALPLIQSNGANRPWMETSIPLNLINKQTKLYFLQIDSFRHFLQQRKAK